MGVAVAASITGHAPGESMPSPTTAAASASADVADVLI
jgi:hypothetical protein